MMAPMLLNNDKYEHARQTRDPRFDGRFFVGVLTTGIYCRPVCPVRVPKKENVQLYPTAAAAAEAGFRPCLRCRPETSPGTPAWQGSSWKVSRALQLIERGLVDDGSIDELAEQLDIGARQLSRLFKQHIGASPVTVAQTRRLHFAKQLIDETDLPMTDICFAAGFGSVRRFNAVFRSVYDRTPLALRKGRKGEIKPDSSILIPLSYRPPFDWRAMLGFLSTRAVPGMEAVSEDSYSRTISLEGKTGDFCARFSNNENRLWLSIRFPDTRQLLRIVDQVRRLFDLRADSNEIDRYLGRDPQLKPLIKNYPGLRVPGCWDGLEIAVRAVIGQQVSVKGASTLMARVVERLGSSYSADGGKLYRVFPTPSQLINGDLNGLGITGLRIEAIKTLARQVEAGQLLMDGRMDTETFVRNICQIKGIGEWTGQYIALRALNDPDAFPHGDLVLQQVGGWPGDRLTAKQLLENAEAWKPWRAYAVMLLWKLAQQVKQQGTNQLRLKSG
ncbi:MAG: DNA-3-methyladenine glycosylase 2 family protein [Pseudohongiellaceae bacterium]